MAPLRLVASMATALVALAGSGCGAGVFACSADAQCDGAGAVCEAEGWCSFPDGDCPSGRRYGAHSGDGLGGVCVPAKATDDPTTSASTSDSTDATIEPTLESSVDTGTTTVPVTDTMGLRDTSSSGMPDESSSGSSGNPDEVLPVAWYTFDDPQDPYADASGNELHAWCGDPECPAWVEGIVGEGAIRVDGAEDHLHVDHVPALELTDELTVAVWAYLEMQPQNGEFLSIFAKPVGAEALNSWQIGVDVEGQLCGGGGNAMEQRGACWAVDEFVGVWHHIAMTWGGDELTLYVDGVAVDSNSTVELGYDELPVMIGADVNYRADAAFFPGLIDDARIYDRVLDDNAISALVARSR